jgi:hypothetical protein
MTAKRLASFILGFFLSVIAFEGLIRVVSPLLGPPLVSWNTMEDAKRLKLRDFKVEYGQPEFVFMGNSTTLIGVNTEVFDKYSNSQKSRSFNAGMNGANIVNIRDFAVDFVIPEVRPKNLVILFSNLGMLLNSDYQAFSPDKDSWLNKSQLYTYRNTLRDPMTLNTLIRVIKYRDTNQGIIYRWAAQLNDFGYQDITRTSITEAGWSPQSNEKIEQTIKVNKNEIKFITEIRDFARSKNINLIIGTVPKLSFDQKLRATVKSVAKELDIGFIQGNDALGTGEFFQDGTHLNYQGSIEFSKFLGSKLGKDSNN